MRLSMKTILGLVFLALVLIGAFLVKSPVDGLPLFTLSNVIYVAGVVLGVTFFAKVMQARKLNKRDDLPILTIVDKLWQLLDPTQGVLIAIVSFVLATVLVYYRVIDFMTWFGYHTTFLIYFNAVNVAKK